ncbi:hypothetical protein E2C01_040053 [Portunus trituberculatus]|uniref:Uncharacterized protein n=1 Tax=Portunus trituberculatus TaxID=210409 RepID=A0A5B7FLF3_PORTR|nr:hypothetical protein [Portunus trituberculatus]
MRKENKQREGIQSLIQAKIQHEAALPWQALSGQWLCCTAQPSHQLLLSPPTPCMLHGGGRHDKLTLKCHLVLLS